LKLFYSFIKIFSFDQKKKKKKALTASFHYLTKDKILIIFINRFIVYFQ